MKVLPMEVLILGLEVVDLRSIRKSILNETEVIASLQDLFQGKNEKKSDSRWHLNS